MYSAQTGTHPKITTERNIERFRTQVICLCSFAANFVSGMQIAEGASMLLYAVPF